MVLPKENYSKVILDVGRCLRWMEEADTKEEYLHWSSRMYDWAELALKTWMEENCI